MPGRHLGPVEPEIEPMDCGSESGGLPLPMASLQWITLWVCLGAPPSTTADRTAILGDLPASLPPEVAEEIAPIDVSYRAVLRQPLEQWQLGPIRESYKG